MKAAFAVSGALALPPMAAADALARAESGSNTSATPYVIALWGPTGAGKSWLGNSLSACGDPYAEPFQESASCKSCTKTASSTLQSIEVPCSLGGTKSLWFEFVDLMGNADTDGDSTESVDQAVLAMKLYKPHLICLVEDGNTRHNVVAMHSLKAMKKCVEGCWGQQNIIQVVNRVEPPKRSRGGGGRGGGGGGVEQMDPQQSREKMMQQRRHALEELLGLTVTMQIVVPQTDDFDDPKLVQSLQAILKVASKVINRVAVEGMQTFTEKQLFAENLANNAFSAERVAEEAKGRLVQQISKQEQDLVWYRQSSGITGMLVRLFSCAEGCEKQLAILKAELLDTQTNLAGTLASEKAKWSAWTKELADLACVMHQKC